MTPGYVIARAANSGQPHEVESITWASDYVEPGYEAGRTLNHINREAAHGVFFANWNPTSFDKDTHKSLRVMARLAEILERMGCDIEWSDEWNTCSDCNKAFRVEPNCYQWVPYYATMHGEDVCGDCIAQNPQEYIETLQNDASRANVFNKLDLSEHGWMLYKDGFESGFHPGQNDKPEDIAKRLRRKGLDFVFEITGKGQFDVSFAVYVPVEQGVRQ